MDQLPSFNRALVEKYDRPSTLHVLPYCPAVPSAFAEDDYRAAAALSNQAQPPKPLSVYIHIPFCKSLCYYCACNKIITHKTERAVSTSEYLKREIAMQGALFDRSRKLTQLHLGGGTPTYFTSEQLADLMASLHQAFNMDDSDSHEFSQVDPRTVTRSRSTACASSASTV